MSERKLTPGRMTLAELRAVLDGKDRITLAGDWQSAVDRAAQTVTDVIAGGDVVYGVNTGFGLLARNRISDDQLRELQVRLVRSHQTGIGAPLEDDVVRLVLVLKAASLARGASGVRTRVVDHLIDMVNAGILPLIPEKGSVGASGDLAPLAHMSAALIGEGNVRVNGEVQSAADALKAAGLEPISLRAKEGLALLNGTQVSTALALKGLFAIEGVFRAALIAGALSVDAMKGSDTPFDPRIHDLRGHQGQIDVASALRSLMDGSRIRESHVDCDRVQDPYSLRCQPQVMGACLDQIRNAARILEIEANAVSDNPLVMSDDGQILSGGNFHAEPVAMAADALAVAVAEVGALSERRTALLIDPAMSGLPAFLIAEPGLNSGFMIAQVTSAAVASENKFLAHPASVDSLPTSANQEDHVSMATFAARRLMPMADNTSTIVAIEILAALQGMEFHQPLASSPPLETVRTTVRGAVSSYDEDRPFTADIEAVKGMIATETLTSDVTAITPTTT